MCNLWSKPTAAGKAPDYGDGTTMYRHTLDGFTIQTHRTVRVSPAGWVYGVYAGVNASGDAVDQYTYGYASTQGDALKEASHYIIAGCGVTA